MIPRFPSRQTSAVLAGILLLALVTVSGCGSSQQIPGVEVSTAAVKMVTTAAATAQSARERTAAAPSAEPPVTKVTAVPTKVDEEPTQEVEETEAIEVLGMVTFDTGFTYEGTEVGGLSGITYDPARDLYYVLSDDRGSVNRPRFYTVQIDLADGTLDEGDVTFLDVTHLAAAGAAPLDVGTIDPESIELVGPELLYISSEGDVGRSPAINPFVKSFGLDGLEIGSLPLPSWYLPGATGNSGVRNNKAFESLAVSPDGRYLYAAVENALLQDGKEATFEKGSPARLLEFDLQTGQPAREFVYLVEPIPVKPNSPGASADNGLVELQAIDNQGTFLTLERAYVEGIGITIRIYETTIDGATDVSGLPSLISAGEEQAPYQPVGKNMLTTMSLWPDNVEGMTLGPELDDGRKVLILVSDNNFNPNQITQFIALAWRAKSQQ